MSLNVVGTPDRRPRVFFVSGEHCIILMLYTMGSIFHESYTQELEIWRLLRSRISGSKRSLRLESGSPRSYRRDVEEEVGGLFPFFTTNIPFSAFQLLDQMFLSLSSSCESSNSHMQKSSLLHLCLPHQIILEQLEYRSLRVLIKMYDS